MVKIDISGTGDIVLKEAVWKVVCLSNPKFEIRHSGVVLKIQVAVLSDTQSQVERQGRYSPCKTLLLNDEFTLLNADLSGKQLMKCALLKRLALPHQTD
jgi:hypothetical protein